MLSNTTLFINCMQGYSHVGFPHIGGGCHGHPQGAHPTPHHPCPYDPRLLGEPPCRCVGGTRRGLAHYCMLSNTTLFINCMQGYSHVGFSHTSGAGSHGHPQGALPDTHTTPVPTTHDWWENCHVGVWVGQGGDWPTLSHPHTVKPTFLCTHPRWYRLQGHPACRLGFPELYHHQSLLHQNHRRRYRLDCRFPR